MRYFGFMPNDFINGEGVCVSVWMAGCPHHCSGCHNQHMWNYEDGYEVDLDTTIEKIIHAIQANGLVRNLSILGGEPLAPYNIKYTLEIIRHVTAQFPTIKVYLWTGYTYEYLLSHLNHDLSEIMRLTTVLIDGKYEEDKRDISLPLRGSSNQRILVHDKHLKPMCFKVYQEEEPTYNSN